MFYATNEYADNNLWEYFREDFQGQTIDTQKLGNKTIIRDLRNFLRRYGVMVEKDGSLIMERLQEVIDNPIEPVQTAEEIEYQIKKEP